MIKTVLFSAVMVLATSMQTAMACQVPTMRWSALTHGTMATRSGQPCYIHFSSTGPIYQVQITRRPSHGSLSVGSVNEIVYKSRPGFTGVDTFCYARVGLSSRNRPLKAGFQIAVTVTQ